MMLCMKENKERLKKIKINMRKDKYYGVILNNL